MKKEELRALLEGATPGDWYALEEHHEDGWPEVRVAPSGAPDDGGDVLATVFAPADARLMAAAPTLARLLLESMERVERQDARIDIYRTRGTCTCGHAFASHDPEDLTCDAHRSDGGFGVCPCGRGES